MTYKVLVVDDSSFFQVRLKEMINEHPELTVVGIAANGQEAIDLADELNPDIISMDYEMPYLDGVSAVRAIMAKKPVPIVMFSSMTYEGARITLDALDAGAVDFIPKNFSEVSKNSITLKKKLHDTLLLFLRPEKQAATLSTTVDRSVINPKTEPEIKKVEVISSVIRKHSVSIKNKIKLVVIGTSTGGPMALTEVIQNLPSHFSVPVVVIQHMPENFTKALAERLDKISSVIVKEAEDGDALTPGSVLVAPGGYQLIFDRRGQVKIIPGDERMSYKPSVDIAFASAANTYGAGVLGVVMTGMGADGCDGARLVKQKGGIIWGQDQASCTIYGMPKAVAAANLTDDVISLSNIGPRLVKDI